MIASGDIGNELIIITKQTFETLIRQEKGTDLCMLYLFYYYTAKWQRSNTIKCTTSYTAKGLGWSVDRVKNAKKALADMGLIENAVDKDEHGRIKGHYISVRYIFSQKTVEEVQRSDFQRVENPEGGNLHRVENPTTNALSNNILNALSNNNKMLCAFEEVWAMYPVKVGKSKVKKKAIAEMEKAGWDVVKQAVENYKQEIDRIRKGGFNRRYMDGSTFFNGGWKDWLTIEPESESTPDTIANKDYGNLYEILDEMERKDGK